MVLLIHNLNKSYIPSISQYMYIYHVQFFFSSKKVLKRTFQMIFLSILHKNQAESSSIISTAVDKALVYSPFLNKTSAFVNSVLTSKKVER